MMTPYLGIYAVQLGANPAEMGWLSALQNLSANTMQIVWGVAMDRIARPILFVLLSGILAGIFWLPLLAVSTPQQIIIVAVIQGLILSMEAPSSLMVANDLVSRSKRSQGITEFHAAQMIGVIPATLLAGYLMSQTRSSLRGMYLIPIIAACVFRVGSSLLLFPMMRRERHEAVRSTESLLSNISVILKNDNLKILYTITLFQGFFLSIAWPLFPIANVVVTGNNMFLIAMLSTTSTVVSSLTRPYFGKLADRLGKKPLIILGRTGIALATLVYAFATEPWHLILANIFIGIFIMADSIVAAYILDNTTPGAMGTSLSFYSLVMGIATFFGSLSGGYIVNGLINIGFEQSHALSMGFLLSTAGRILTGIACAKLKEEKTS